MISIVKVTRVSWMEAYRLHVVFSDGTSGAHDFSHMVALTGPMIEPLKHIELFKKVFVRLGVLTWPNGFDIDAIQLHSEMKSAGELVATAAE
jgi:hypothetical protein